MGRCNAKVSKLFLGKNLFHLRGLPKTKDKLLIFLIFLNAHAKTVAEVSRPSGRGA